VVILAAVAIFVVSTLSLNAFGRAHKPLLQYSSPLAWAAQAHADDLALPRQRHIIEAPRA
jgi:hypothetical protein